jgi:hypothetical protein
LAAAGNAWGMFAYKRLATADSGFRFVLPFPDPLPLPSCNMDKKYQAVHIAMRAASKFPPHGRRHAVS